MNAPVPTEVTLDQYTDACVAFLEALGVPPGAALCPMIVTEDAIHLTVVPTRQGGQYDGEPFDAPFVNGAKQMPSGTPATGVHPQHDPHGELTCAVTIKVLRDDPNEGAFAEFVGSTTSSLATLRREVNALKADRKRGWFR